MADNNGVKEITDDSFDEGIAKGVSLVDFWAPWCHPCRYQTPILEKVADRIGEQAQIYKLNVDESRETAAKYNITGIPTLIVFKEGEKVTQLVGLQQEEDLISALKAHV